MNVSKRLQNAYGLKPTLYGWISDAERKTDDAFLMLNLGRKLGYDEL